MSRNGYREPSKADVKLFNEKMKSAASPLLPFIKDIERVILTKMLEDMTQARAHASDAYSKSNDPQDAGQFNAFKDVCTYLETALATLPQ